MATENNEAKKQQADSEQAFNSSSISRMSYSEIIKANRAQHSGTFMDRSWRFDDERNGSKVLNDKSLTFWQKLTNGAYTYQAMSARFINNFEARQVKVQFVEGIVQGKAEFKEEDD